MNNEKSKYFIDTFRRQCEIARIKFTYELNDNNTTTFRLERNGYYSLINDNQYYFDKFPDDYIELSINRFNREYDRKDHLMSLRITAKANCKGETITYKDDDSIELELPNPFLYKDEFIKSVKEKGLSKVASYNLGGINCCYYDVISMTDSYCLMYLVD